MQLLIIMLIAEAILQQLGIINCIFLQIDFPSVIEVGLVENGNSDSVVEFSGQPSEGPATNKSDPELNASEKRTNGPGIVNYHCYYTGYVVE